MADWKKLVATVAPTIATALGGPLAGVAVQALGGALGINGADEQTLAAKLAGATAEDLLKIKQAEQAFVLEMKKAEIDIMRVDSDDRNSARAREVNLKDKTPAILAALITIGFFGVLGYLLKVGLPAAGGEPLLLVLGALTASWGAIVNYYFGSSSGSAQKTKLLSMQGGVNHV